MKNWFGAVLALVAAATPASAQQQAAATYCASNDLPESKQTNAFFGPMTYRVQSTPNGAVLLAEGEIRIGEGERLRAALAGARNIQEVWFNSPGGAALEGPLMGRILRQKGMAVRLTAQHACASACSYAFLGGVIRVVEPGAHYGLHMFSQAGSQEFMLALVAEGARLSTIRQRLLKEHPQADVDAATAQEMGKIFRSIEKDAAQTAAIRARYLVEMSLSLDFMTDAFGTDSSSMCYLSPAGLARYNVANSR